MLELEAISKFFFDNGWLLRPDEEWDEASEGYEITFSIGDTHLWACVYDDGRLEVWCKRLIFNKNLLEPSCFEELRKVLKEWDPR